MALGETAAGSVTEAELELLAAILARLAASWWSAHRDEPITPSAVSFEQKQDSRSTSRAKVIAPQNV